jgi:hypothetical protein
MKKWVRFGRIVQRIGRAVRLLCSPKLPWRERLLVLAPLALYWVLPDVLPFTPLDDVAVTLAVLTFVEQWLTKRAQYHAQRKRR